MSKKAQITLLILIGVILLLIGGLIIYLAAGPTPSPEITIPGELQPVKIYLDSCIEETAKNAIVNNSLHGGYYELPLFSTQGYYVDSPYYFHELEIQTPTLDVLESELALYMNNELKDCIDLTQFTEQGINIELGNVTSKALIRRDSVLFTLDFPVTITRQETQTKLPKFQTIIRNIRLSTIHNASAIITEEQANDPFSLCLSCLTDIAIVNSLKLDTTELGDDTILFTITDYNSKINEQPLQYRFSNKYLSYDCSNLPTTLPESVLKSKLIGCLEE